MAVRSLNEVPIYTGLTYEKYLDLPEIKQRYDILDGDLFMSPAPSDLHQWILKDIALRLEEHVSATRSGVVLFAPLDVVIHRAPRLRTRQPDIVFYSSHTIGGTSRSTFHAARERDVPPDLAIEILSTFEHRQAVTAKLEDYTEIGVGEVWLVDPSRKAIVVMALADGALQETARFDESDDLHSELLPGFSMRVGDIFE